MNRNAFAPVESLETNVGADDPFEESGVVVSNPYTSATMPTTGVGRSDRTPSSDDLILPTENEELFVVNELKRIPTRDLISMARNPIEFAVAMLIFKIMRVPNPPFFAAALKNPTEVSRDRIPDFWRSEFAQEESLLTTLGFVEPHFSTSPTIGTRTSLELIMVSTDGRIQSSFARIVNLNGKIREQETLRSLYSNLTDGRTLVTRAKSAQARPDDWEDVQCFRTKSFEVLLEHHRIRMSEKNVRRVDSGGEFDNSAAAERRSIDDLVRRGILRAATAKEIFRIEAACG